MLCGFTTYTVEALSKILREKEVQVCALIHGHLALPGSIPHTPPPMTARQPLSQLLPMYTLVIKSSLTWPMPKLLYRIALDLVQVSMYVICCDDCVAQDMWYTHFSCMSTMRVLLRI